MNFLGFFSSTRWVRRRGRWGGGWYQSCLSVGWCCHSSSQWSWCRPGNRGIYLFVLTYRTILTIFHLVVKQEISGHCKCGSEYTCDDDAKVVIILFFSGFISLFLYYYFFFNFFFFFSLIYYSFIICKLIIICLFQVLLFFNIFINSGFDWFTYLLII